jgi:hypothetical protein
MTENAKETAKEALEECSNMFAEIDAILQKSKKSSLGRLMLPFRDTKIELLRNHIDKLKSTLQLLLSVLTIAHQAASRELSREAVVAQKAQIQELLELSRKSTKKYEESVKNFSINSNETLPVDEPGSNANEHDSVHDFKTAAIGSTINPKTLETCVHHVRTLLNSIENLQRVLTNAVEGDDHSEHHQTLMGSYFCALDHLEGVLGGSQQRGQMLKAKSQMHRSTSAIERADDEEARKTDEMEALYTFRQARYDEGVDREGIGYARPHIRTGGDVQVLEDKRHRAKEAADPSVSQTIIAEHQSNTRAHERTVADDDLGVASHDGTRLRVNMPEYESEERNRHSPRELEREGGEGFGSAAAHAATSVAASLGAANDMKSRDKDYEQRKPPEEQEGRERKKGRERRRVDYERDSRDKADDRRNERSFVREEKFERQPEERPKHPAIAEGERAIEQQLHSSHGASIHLYPPGPMPTSPGASRQTSRNDKAGDPALQNTPIVSHGYHRRQTSSAVSHTGTSRTPSLYVISDDYNSTNHTRNTRLPSPAHGMNDVQLAQDENSTKNTEPKAPHTLRRSPRHFRPIQPSSTSSQSDANLMLSPSIQHRQINNLSLGPNRPGPHERKAAYDYNFKVVTPRGHMHESSEHEAVRPDYHDLTDRSASSHASSSAAGHSRWREEPEQPPEKDDEEDENQKQVRFELGRANSRKWSRAETKLAESEKQRAINREEARRQKGRDREEEAANSSTKQPSKTRRETAFMTLMQKEEQRRLLAAELEHMQEEMKTVNVRRLRKKDKGVVNLPELDPAMIPLPRSPLLDLSPAQGDEQHVSLIREPEHVIKATYIERGGRGAPVRDLVYRSAREDSIEDIPHDLPPPGAQYRQTKNREEYAPHPTRSVNRDDCDRYDRYDRRREPRTSSEARPMLGRTNSVRRTTILQPAPPLDVQTARKDAQSYRRPSARMTVSPIATFSQDPWDARNYRGRIPTKSQTSEDQAMVKLEYKAKMKKKLKELEEETTRSARPTDADQREKLEALSRHENPPSPGSAMHSPTFKPASLKGFRQRVSPNSQSSSTIAQQQASALENQISMPHRPEVRRTSTKLTAKDKARKDEEKREELMVREEEDEIEREELLKREIEMWHTESEPEVKEGRLKITPESGTLSPESFQPRHRTRLGHAPAPNVTIYNTTRMDNESTSNVRNELRAYSAERGRQRRRIPGEWALEDEIAALRLEMERDARARSREELQNRDRSPYPVNPQGYEDKIQLALERRQENLSPAGTFGAPISEDDLVNKQMALLLMKSDLRPNPDMHRATFRIDMPEDTEHSEQQEHDAGLSQNTDLHPEADKYTEEGLDQIENEKEDDEQSKDVVEQTLPRKKSAAAPLFKWARGSKRKKSRTNKPSSVSSSPLPTPQHEVETDSADGYDEVDELLKEWTTVF